MAAFPASQSPARLSVCLMPPAMKNVRSRCSPGDLFVAFSDGVTEPENTSEEFGEDRLIALIQEQRDQPLADIGTVITNAVADWIGDEEQPDDVTVVLARAS
jgi:sigma-B regulation protein RsbU (phosphoserine phosphatase)